MILQNEAERLTAAAAAVERASHGLSRASVDMALAHRTRNLDPLPRAVSRASEAHQDAKNAVVLLASLGAVPTATATAERRAVPIELLDTEATRELLGLLEQAVYAATRVDRERGWIDDDGRGLGWAETVAGLALGLGYEIKGPDADKSGPAAANLRP